MVFLHLTSTEAAFGGEHLEGSQQAPPSRALLEFLFWGRVPLLKWTTERKGALILASPLEDLVKTTFVGEGG